jgi:hypothetical protein
MPIIIKGTPNPRTYPFYVIDIIDLLIIHTCRPFYQYLDNVAVTATSYGSLIELLFKTYLVHGTRVLEYVLYPGTTIGTS